MISIVSYFMLLFIKLQMYVFYMLFSIYFSSSVNVIAINFIKRWQSRGSLQNMKLPESPAQMLNKNNTLNKKGTGFNKIGHSFRK